MLLIKSYIPSCIKITILLPELSKLLFHGPVGRKHFLYFRIVKISNFSIEGKDVINYLKKYDIF